MKYRSRTEIVISILDAANKIQGTSRTRLIYKPYISFNLIISAEKILENGLMDYEVGKRGYRMIEKGILSLQLQNKMEQIAYYLSNKIYLYYKLLFSLIDRATSQLYSF